MFCFLFFAFESEEFIWKKICYQREHYMTEAHYLPHEVSTIDKIDFSNFSLSPLSLPNLSLSLSLSVLHSKQIKFKALKWCNVWYFVTFKSYRWQNFQWVFFLMWQHSLNCRAKLLHLYISIKYDLPLRWSLFCDKVNIKCSDSESAMFSRLIH